MAEAVGVETMSAAMQDVSCYYDWLFDALSPYLGRQVLEIGPGYGNMAQRIMQSGRSYKGVDLDSGIIANLQKRQPEMASQWIAGDVTDAQWMAAQKIQADTLLSMNVLEHLADDRAHLLALVRQKLARRFVLFVPAMPWLYGSFDRDAGHYRRYYRRDLLTLLQTAGLHVRELRYFNGMGALAWWVAARVLHMSISSSESGQSILWYDRYFIPIARGMDPLIRPFVGQSLLAVADQA